MIRSPVGARRLQGGFTLIELIVVVAILGILAAVLLPKVLSAMDDAKSKSALSTGKQLQVGMERYNITNNGYPAVPATVDATWLNSKLGSYVNINVSNISSVTYTATSLYTLSVGLTDSGKTVTVTPTTVSSN